MALAFLIARQRSGTGALGSVLDKHPDLRYVGEVFHPDNFGASGNYFTFLHERVKEDPKRALPNAQAENFTAFAEMMQGRFPNQTVIIDIKYRSLHQANGGWQGLAEMPWLLGHAKREGLPVIHLTRKNYVESFVSGRLAEANKVWHARQEDEIKVTSTVVNLRNLSNYLVSTDREVALIREWLGKSRKVLEVDYGDLFDREGTLRPPLAERLSKLFDIGPFEDREPAFKKQAPARLRESIRNFPLIAEGLAGTKHEWMLE